MDTTVMPIYKCVWDNRFKGTNNIVLYKTEEKSVTLYKAVKNLPVK